MFYHQQSGLYLAIHRAYDPVVGRWTSRDPIGENGGLNLYGYVAGNPLVRADPSGKGPIGVVVGTIYGGFSGYMGASLDPRATFSDKLFGALWGAGTGGAIAFFDPTEGLLTLGTISAVAAAGGDAIAQTMIISRCGGIFDYKELAAVGASNFAAGLLGGYLAAGASRAGLSELFQATYAGTITLPLANAWGIYGPSFEPATPQPSLAPANSPSGRTGMPLRQ